MFRSVARGGQQAEAIRADERGDRRQRRVMDFGSSVSLVADRILRSLVDRGRWADRPRVWHDRRVFTVEYRDRVLEMAHRDARVVAGAAVGALAAGSGDRWSDLDLTFGLADGVSTDCVLAD